MNKRERYTKENMPENVAILYERFSDYNFISKFTQFMVLDEEKGKINFDARRFNMFKVKIEFCPGIKNKSIYLFKGNFS
jgi:hypothetical protein